jgi:hypothetical protein
MLDFSDTSKVSLYVNGSYVTQVTTNLPSLSASVGCLAHVKTTDSTGKNLFLYDINAWVA